MGKGDEFMPIVLLIALMALSTAIPRVLPALFLGQSLRPSLRQYLHAIPYAALGALIWPGILYTTESPHIGLVGGITAFVLVYLRLPVLVVISGATLAAVLV